MVHGTQTGRYDRINASSLSLNGLLSPFSFNEDGELGLFATATTDNAFARLIGLEHRAVLFGPGSIWRPQPKYDDTLHGHNHDRRSLQGLNDDDELPYEMCDRIALCYRMVADSVELEACLDMAADASYLQVDTTLAVDDDTVFGFSAGWVELSSDGGVGVSDVHAVASDGREDIFVASGNATYAHNFSSASIALDWATIGSQGTLTHKHTFDAAKHPHAYSVTSHVLSSHHFSVSMSFAGYM